MNSSGNMELREWFANMANDAQQFASYWLDKSQEDPKNFPEAMLAGDWDEQFGIFREANAKEDAVAPSNIIQFPVKVSLECPDCRGSGMITAFAGRVQGQHKCPRCDGSGKIGAK